MQLTEVVNYMYMYMQLTEVNYMYMYMQLTEVVNYMYIHLYILLERQSAYLSLTGKIISTKQCFFCKEGCKDTTIAQWAA